MRMEIPSSLNSYRIWVRLGHKVTSRRGLARLTELYMISSHSKVILLKGKDLQLYLSFSSRPLHLYRPCPHSNSRHWNTHTVLKPCLKVLSMAGLAFGPQQSQIWSTQQSNWISEERSISKECLQYTALALVPLISQVRWADRQARKTRLTFTARLIVNMIIYASLPELI